MTRDTKEGFIFILLGLPAAIALSLLLVAYSGQQVAPTQDIVDTAMSTGEFQTLARALHAADLVDTLKGEGPFTVFAPTDEAFEKLPAGTLEELLKPENKQKLVSILTYHVVQGKLAADELASMEYADTLNGHPVALSSIAGTVVVNEASVTQPDIQCSNGVIHVVDSVLMPE